MNGLLTTMPRKDVISFKTESMIIQVFPDRKAASAAAAQSAANEMRRLDRLGSDFGVIFATGDSQIIMLESLISIPGLPWGRLHGFHLDEYVGLDENHPASFRRYLRERLTSRVPIREFFEIEGNVENSDSVCNEYLRKLQLLAPPKLCLLGIGENGHLAFNDPAKADFNDPAGMKVVTLDKTCRQQQVAEGWFERLEDVPQHALTLTIPTIFRVPKLIVTVPGSRKAQAVLRTLDAL